MARTNPTPAPSRFKREVHDSMPARARSASTRYDVWAPEVADARKALGKAFSYEGIENANTEAQGIRRTYGVVTRVKDYDEATKVGTIWLQYPFLDDGEGNLTPNDDEVEKIKAKYAGGSAQARAAAANGEASE